MKGGNRKKTLVSWSSGKDSAWMLDHLLAENKYHVAGLFTTINEKAARVAMHAVRVELLRVQAQSIGFELKMVPIPDPCSNTDYGRIMAAFLTDCIDEGIAVMAFGDLFLQDIRTYREKQLINTGIKPIFPIWLHDTSQLGRNMIAKGYKAIVTSIELKKLDRRFIGRKYDEQFIDDLPSNIDPCGEHGEFHTFVYDGPIFKYPIGIKKGAIMEKEGFLYQDLIYQS
jgi:uncharacterized protein (TIGR00290 family)